jgi:DNA polymerase delta subunit 1
MLTPFYPAIYGFLTAQKLRCKPIGSSVTAEGRRLNTTTRDFVEITVPGSEVVYGDTDSVFIRIPGTTRTSFDTEGLAHRISALFPDPIRIEYEKVYEPFLLLSRKRYLGIKYEAGGEDGKGKRESKGDILQRRDSCQLLKNTYDTACDILMTKKLVGVSECLELLVETLRKVAAGEADVEDLAITRAVTKPIEDYKVGHLPHIEAAKRKIARGETVESNERLRIVFVADKPGPGTPDWSRCEVIEHVRDKKLPYDRQYYVRCFVSPMTSLLGIMVPEEKLRAIFDTAIHMASRATQRNSDIRGFLEAKEGKVRQREAAFDAGDVNGTIVSGMAANKRPKKVAAKDESGKKQGKLDSFFVRPATR